MDRDGYISNGELYLVLKQMVGNNLKDQQLQQIVDKTIMEADKDGWVARGVVDLSCGAQCSGEADAGHRRRLTAATASSRSRSLPTWWRTRTLSSELRWP